MPHTLGFIGAGNMAEAIARAAIDHGVLRPGDMIACDPTEARRAVFTSMGIATTADNAAVVAGSAQVLLAVKPQVMAQAATDVSRHGTAEQVVISIMAGVTTAKLADAIGHPTRIVRVMPNTPMMVGLGMAGVSLGPGAQPGDDDLAMRLFSAGGSRAIRVDEAHLDAITAVSGSGPAYLFYLAEAMERAAGEMGLGEHARELVAQTLLGAATLLSRSGESPTELRRKVTSPGGTTEAAIRTLDGSDARDLVVRALHAAEHRSRELGA
jgi:pyrroline-5-carboxylate reductase